MLMVPLVSSFERHKDKCGFEKHKDKKCTALNFCSRAVPMFMSGKHFLVLLIILTREDQSKMQIFRGLAVRKIGTICRMHFSKVITKIFP